MWQLKHKSTCSKKFWRRNNKVKSWPRTSILTDEIEEILLLTTTPLQDKLLEIENPHQKTKEYLLLQGALLMLSSSKVWFRLTAYQIRWGMFRERGRTLDTLNTEWIRHNRERNNSKVPFDRQSCISLPITFLRTESGHCLHACLHGSQCVQIEIGKNLRCKGETLSSSGR